MFKARRPPTGSVEADSTAMRAAQSMLSDLQAALTALCDGAEPDLKAVDPLSASLLARLQQRFAVQDREGLRAAVAASMAASRAQAAVSLTFGEVTAAQTETQTMAAAIEELDASVRQIADLASHADQSLTAAAAGTREGVADAEATARAAHHVSEVLAGVEAEMSTLSGAADQIRGMAATIETIASQTNLLALNATIESARAGAAGRGFAVVAQEVKSLAGQTSKSTDDIRIRIERLEQAVASMAKATAAARVAAQGAEADAGSASGKVAGAASQQAEATGSVARVAQVLTEQSKAVRELAEGVSRAAESSKRAKQFIDTTVQEVAVSEGAVNTQFQSLEERGVSNYVLYRAKSDHLLWKKRLAGLLSGLSSLEERELSDHHSCRLGKWWDTQKETPAGTNASFRAIEAPHARVHEAGRLAARLFHSGDKDGAAKAFAAMEAASVDVVARLDELIAEVEQN